jgi:hypothetical protein
MIGPSNRTSNSKENRMKTAGSRFTWAAFGVALLVSSIAFAGQKGLVAPTPWPAEVAAKLSPSLRNQAAKTALPLRVIVLLEESRTPSGISGGTADASAYLEETRRASEDVIRENGVAAVKHVFGSIGGFSATVTPDALERLARDPRVKLITPVFQASKKRKEGNALMGVPAAHSRGIRGAGVAVAIIDDGVDYSHPELGGGAFPNSVVIGGYDFDYKVDDPSPEFRNGAFDSHGTSIAGIIAGRGDGQGGLGVAPDAKIVGLRAGGETLDSDNVLASLDWVATNHNRLSVPLKVVNMSLGFDGLGYFTSNCNGNQDGLPLEQAITRVTNLGIAVVAATGNESKLGTSIPSCYANVISVGAVYDGSFGPVGYESCNDSSSAADQVTCYSNAATFVSLLAPSHMARTPRAGGGYDSQFGGTSAAAPYAAGSIAALMAKYPGKTVAQYLAALRTTGKQIVDQAAGGITTPRIDLDKAAQSLAGASTGGPKPFISYLLAASKFAGGGGTFFQSDVRIYNAGNAPASVDALLLANSDNSGQVPAASFTVGAKQSVAYDDMILSLFGMQTGGGAVLFASSQPIVVTSDLYTLNNVCPGVGGTLGQFIPALDPDQASTRQRIFNVIHDGRFRANFGVINVSDRAMNVRVSIVGANGAVLRQKDYPVGPYGWRQINRIFADMGSPNSSNATLLVEATQPVLTYASIVDERTGDPFLVWGANE